MGKVKVQCAICNKEEYVYESRAKRYKTCSVKCMGISSRADNNVECCVCHKKFHLKQARIKRVKHEVTCSNKCKNNLKAIIYSGRNNPNTKYFSIDDGMFNNVDTLEKAYLLGWIASDGHVGKNFSTSIKIHKKDIECLKLLRDLVSKDLLIKHDEEKNQVSLTINSKQISNDICKLLNIKRGKKSHIVDFPKLKTKKLGWSFVRGYFDGDGCVANPMRKKKYVRCSIATSSLFMVEGIKHFCKLNPSVYKSKDCYTIEFTCKKALLFLKKMYKDCGILYLERKRQLYFDWLEFLESRQFLKSCQQ